MKIKTEARPLISWLAHCTGVALLTGAAYAAAQPQATEAIAVEQSPSLVTFVGGTTKSATGQLKVRIDGPDGQTVFESVSEAGILDWVPEAILPDGRYSWDAWYVPQSPLGQPHEKYHVKGANEATSDYRSGSFHIEGGSLVIPKNPSIGEQASLSWPERALGAVLTTVIPPASAAGSHNDAVDIIDNAADELTFARLNNSSNNSTGICNEDGNLELFVDGACTGGNQEFLIMDNAPSNSLSIDSAGEVGLGTSTPQNSMHIVDQNPRIRYERTGSNSWVAGTAGDSAQVFLIGSNELSPEFRLNRSAPGSSFTMDDAGNIGLGTLNPEGSLHISDTLSPSLVLEDPDDNHQWQQFLSADGGFVLQNVTSGAVPFLIDSGAPSASFGIAADGNVGVGTTSPQSNFDVQTSAGAFRVGPFGSGSVKLSSSASYGMDASQYRFQTSGTDRFFIGNEGNIGIGTISPSSKLEVNTGAGTFNVEAFGAGSVKLSSSASYGMDASQYRFLVSGTDTFFIGNSRNIGIGTNSPSTRLEVNGEVTATAFNTSSSIEVKERLNSVDGNTILAKLDELPVKEWSYKESPDHRHIGPMAEDFHARFGLGMDNKHISPTDVSGVALVAVKALQSENEALKARIEKMSDLESRIKVLENRLSEMPQ